MVRHSPNFLVIVLLILAGVVITHVGQAVWASNNSPASTKVSQAFTTPGR